MNRERCEGWGLAGAAAVVAGVFAYSHGPIIWKLAQETLFYADFAGLRELLGPCSAPGGLLLMHIFKKIPYISNIISYLFFSSDFTLYDNLWVHPG